MNKERLLQLAEHLEHGKLGHKVFDFSQYNNSIENTCGTMGCAIGECPIIWPNDWKFSIFGTPRMSTKPMETLAATREWFDIDDESRLHLFTPFNQLVHIYGGESLDGEATKEQVAANIRAFVEKKLNS